MEERRKRNWLDYALMIAVVALIVACIVWAVLTPPQIGSIFQNIGGAM